MSFKMPANEVGAGDFIRHDGSQVYVHVKGRPIDGNITFQVSAKSFSQKSITVGERDELDVVAVWPNVPAGFTLTLAKKR